MARKNYSKIKEMSEHAVEPSSEVVEPSSEVVEPSSEVVEPSSEVVEPSSEVVEPIVKDNKVFAVKCPGKLNVRSRPSKEAAIICVINNGAEVFVDAVLDGWVKIFTSSGVEGYVMKEFVTL